MFDVLEIVFIPQQISLLLFLDFVICLAVRMAFSAHVNYWLS